MHHNKVLTLNRNKPAILSERQAQQQHHEAQQRQHQNTRKMDEINGHEIILKTLIKKSARCVFDLINGARVEGRITQFDRFTITVQESEKTSPTTMFKHSIQSFSGVSA